MNCDDSNGESCPYYKYITNPDAYVAHLILEHNRHHKNANEITRERFEDYNLVLHDPDYQKSTEEMPVCIDCSYHVGTSSSDNGDYYCNNCRAILTEEDVREP